MQAHCQSPASPRSNQSFVKELAKPTHKKMFLKNFPSLQKKIKIHRHTAQLSKQTMTQKLNIERGYKQSEKEGQQVTLYKSNSG